jgi:predicted metalloprotease
MLRRTPTHLFLARLALLFAVLAIIAGAALASNAHALNPERTSLTAVVNTVYWDLDRFWIPSRRPGVAYFNYTDSSGRLVNRRTACNFGGNRTTTTASDTTFFCNGNIYFNYRTDQRLLGYWGDGQAAFTMAHEYGHHVEHLLGVSWNDPYHELLANCFAGMYFRHAIYTSAVLTAADYQEARAFLANIREESVHGTRAQNLRSFGYGFQQTNYHACLNGSRNW